MEIGILGLPLSGKSTLFEIMTGVKSHDRYGESCVRGLATVPDKRFDHLVDVFQPVKASPAKVLFIDINVAGEGTWNPIRQNLSGTDGFLHLVDGFSTPHVQEAVKQYRKLEDELILSDLLIVENRLERLAKMSKKASNPQDASQGRLLERLKEQLEGGKTIRERGLTADEIRSLRSFSFLTISPELVIINTGEENPFTDSFRTEANTSTPVIGICCAIEKEIASLPPAEQKEYLSVMGIEEPAFKRIISMAFSLLGCISFFTVGGDEVKSWVIPAGSKAPKAAGTIHKDFERGFIKAEVVSYDDFVTCGNSLAGAKANGKLRLEGKDYIVKDGDIITFRFNV
ncbi:MAG: DUF933 domain-containing protein [Syntrophales bacterium]|nr:DUF933 domain-containing protein [Syntrophales bacterium]